MVSPAKGSRRWWLVLALLAGLAGLGWVGVMAWLARPLPLTTPSVELSIEPGDTPREVADAWVKAGVQTRPQWLYLWFRGSGQARKIRAGSFQIGPGTTPRQLLDKMVQGDETLVKLLLVEGWTMRQFRQALAAAPGLKPVAAKLDDAGLLAAIGAGSGSAEGQFFPDTYAYSRGVSDLAVLARAHAAMQRQLDLAWTQRAADSPLTSPQELLILASIVEKETGPKDDPRRIAAVFANRLRLGMPLQSDPTLIYGLGEAFDGNLRKRDLLADGPYNSYTRPGLPPTPIAMPSRASLLAAAQPAPIRSLYFVARGDGSSVFSDNLADHNRAVNQYQRGRQR